MSTVIADVRALHVVRDALVRHRDVLAQLGPQYAPACAQLEDEIDRAVASMQRRMAQREDARRRRLNDEENPVNDDERHSLTQARYADEEAYQEVLRLRELFHQTKDALLQHVQKLSAQHVPGLTVANDHMSTMIAALERYAALLFPQISSVSSVTSNSTNPATRHILTHTAQTWSMNQDGTRVFDHPLQTASNLITTQIGSDTCGLCSCGNVVSMAGVTVTEDSVVRTALRECDSLRKRYEAGGGGSTPDERQQVLETYGIQSELQEQSIANIARAVSEGRGVIISVHAEAFWNNLNYLGTYHAVTVTSVHVDAQGTPLGFYVCDTGDVGNPQRGSMYYSAEHIADALTIRPMNVTSHPIR